MSRINHKTLPQKVSSQVLQRIVDGEYIPGATLPNENEMAVEYGVSRIVIREATRLLSTKGVIDIKQGRGTFVAPQEHWDQLDPQILLALLHAGQLGNLAQDLLEVRKLLEVEAAGLAALRATPEDIHLLKTSLDDMKRTSAQHTKAYIALEHQFHRQIWHIAANRLLLYMLESLSEVFVLVKQLVYRANWEDVDRDHQAAFLAIQAHDAEAARQAIAADISRFESEIQQALESGMQGSAVDFSE